MIQLDGKNNIIAIMVRSYTLRDTDRSMLISEFEILKKRVESRESTNLSVFSSTWFSTSEFLSSTFLPIITQIDMYSMTLMMSKEDYLNKATTRSSVYKVAREQHAEASM